MHKCLILVASKLCLERLGSFKSSWQTLTTSKMCLRAIDSNERDVFSRQAKIELNGN